jgi:hypothetical protein
VKPTTKEKNMTVKEIVQANQEAALACKTPQEIRAFIESIGCATQLRWKKAVEAIVEIGGLDYYQAKAEQQKKDEERLKSEVTHEITLYSDAAAAFQRYAICGGDKQPLWYGRFFEDDRSFSYGDPAEQSACECAAARKAIWLASKVKEAVGAKAIRLKLLVDAQWLVSLSGKAAILASDAKRFGVALGMEWVPGDQNPADQYSRCRGFKRWDEEPLPSLAHPVASAEPQELMA